MLAKIYGDGYMIIDKVIGNYVHGRFIEEGSYQFTFEKYLLRNANGKPQGFMYGVTFHEWDSFKEIPIK